MEIHEANLIQAPPLFSGKRMFLWRAVDDEGEVLDVVVQHRRYTAAATRLLKLFPITSLLTQKALRLTAWRPTVQRSIC